MARGGRSQVGGGHRERSFQDKSLGSEARALRKYACDAMQKWETLHVSAKLQMKAARDDSWYVFVGRARGSNCSLLGLDGKMLDNRPRSRYR
eukprot:6071644-Pleurochrysis_carterae.AAC.2